MSKRLTIRRVGPIVPAICLIVFLLLVVLQIILATAGIPRSIIDTLEKEALNQGVPLKIEKITINFFRRSLIKAKGIRVYATPTDEKPIITARSLSASLSVAQLITGKVDFRAAELKGAELALPISDSTQHEQLKITDINLTANINNDVLALRTSNLHLQGIPIGIKGIFRLNELDLGDSAQEEQEKLVIPAIIKTCQSIIDRVYHQIEEQHWNENEYPELELHIAAGSDINVRVTATAPKYDIDNFCFRDTKLDLSYEGDRVLINNLEFKTIKPSAHVQLKGGYEIDTRKVSVTLESDAALLDMAKALSLHDQVAILGKISHKPEHAPHINLNIQAEFGDDFHLNNAVINGEIQQKELHIGSSLIDNIQLSFYYSNGNFNIDNMLMEFPDGNLHFTAVSNDGIGSAELDADLSVLRTISLVNEFLDEPLFLPVGLKYGNNLKLKARATLNMPQFMPGQSYSDLFVPALRSLDAELTLDQFAFLTYNIQKPTLSVSCAAAEGSDVSMLRALHQATVKLSGESLQLQHHDKLDINADTPSITLEFNNITKDAETGQLRVETSEADIMAEKISALGISAEKLHLSTNVSAFAYGSNMEMPETLAAQLKASHLNNGEISADNMQLKADIKADTSTDATHILDSALLQAQIVKICRQENELGNLTTEVHLENETSGKLSLTFTPTATADLRPARLAAETDLSAPWELKLKNIQADIPLADLASIFKVFRWHTDAIELPEDISLQGNLSIKTDDFSLKSLDAKVAVPKLVRTPQELDAFKGKKIEVGIAADVKAEVSGNDTGADVTAHVQVTHKTGELQATITGNTATHIHASGTNSIRADVVDQLLDLEDAHDILKDFRFPEGSKSQFDNIAVDVKYENGISLAVDCDIFLKKAEYQLSAIIENENGKEVYDPVLGKLPFVSTEQAKAHLRVNWSKDVTLNGKVQPQVIEVIISDASILYNNAPWLTLQDFTGLGINKASSLISKNRTSLLEGDKVVIDVENDAVRLYNVRGTVYPAYSLGMFYSDLRDHMSILLTPYPVKVSTQYCGFPIAEASKEPMKGNISLSSPKLCGLDFLATTIPLTKLTGFVSLSDGYVYLDRMNARSWEGTIDAVVKIGISGPSTSFDGYVKAKNMDLKAIAAAYGTKMDTALCEADFRFKSPTPELSDIQGYGKGRIVNGNLLSLSIFRPIGAFVSDVSGNMKELDESAKHHQTNNVLQSLRKGTGATINAIGSGLDQTAQNIPGYNHMFAYDLQNANIEYVIDKGHFKTRHFEATGYNLKVSGLLDINLLNSEIYGNMWPQVSSLPTVLLSPLTFVSDFMLDIVIFGKVDNIDWSFKLDKRLNSDSPTTATTKADKACSKTPKKAQPKAKR